MSLAFWHFFLILDKIYRRLNASLEKMERALKWLILVCCKEKLGRSVKSCHEIERNFNNHFPNRPMGRKYLRQIVSKFTTTGNVHNKRQSSHV